jgi:hypothetical protein
VKRRSELFFKIIFDINIGSLCAQKHKTPSPAPSKKGIATPGIEPKSLTYSATVVWDPLPIALPRKADRHPLTHNG